MIKALKSLTKVDPEDRIQLVNHGVAIQVTYELGGGFA